MNCQKEASKKGYSHILIMEDFKYKRIIWKNWSMPGLSESSEEFLFVEALRDCYFYQHITKLTRIRHGQESSTLDLVITNEEGMIEDIKYHSPLGKSDNIVICFNFICYTQQTNRNTGGSHLNWIFWEHEILSGLSVICFIYIKLYKEKGKKLAKILG